MMETNLGVIFYVSKYSNKITVTNDHSHAQIVMFNEPFIAMDVNTLPAYM